MARERQSPHGKMACDSMCAWPLKLPMQDLSRDIKYWSVGISHVHGSGHNVRVFHEVIISMVREALLVMCPYLQVVWRASKVCVVRLGSVGSAYRATLTSRITRTKPSTGPGEAPKSNPSHAVGTLCNEAYVHVGNH